MKTGFALIAAALSAAQAAASPIGLMMAEREVRWAGCVTSQDGETRQINVWPSEPGFIVEYPESGCSGWHMPAALESWVDANERLTQGPHGAAACETSGDQVVYTIEEGVLRLQFFNVGDRSAEARLSARPDQPACERTEAS